MNDRAQNATKKPETILAGTSGKGKSFKKHCLRCMKYHNHRHTPAELNTPCDLCPCTYFFSWEAWSKKFKKPLKELRNGKPIEVI